jgi:SAM-dependent MidA family methyltransferase
MTLTLPQPDPIALEHSQKLQQKIITCIQKKGPLSFAEYMQMALYEPYLGYYNAGAYKFGTQGDFVTAPEISSLFSKCLAKQCAQVLKDLNNGVILEFGAGSGRMALEVLRELQRQQSLPDQYLILEVSADLQERQKQLFLKEAPHFLEKIQWLQQWPTEAIRGVVLANEVMDALPVHKFKWQQNKLYELYVDIHQNQFIWHLNSPSSPQLQAAISHLDVPFPDEYESEINLMLPAWIQGIAECLKQGLVLLIDYGFPRHEFYHPDRDQGTLMCHYQHRAHADPLILAGIQDITAHIDFTAVAEAATTCGLEVEGFTHQAAFLINCGLAEMLHFENEFERIQINQQVKQLTSPSEMGELFKVCALTRDYSAPLIGFKMMNQLERL